MDTYKSNERKYRNIFFFMIGILLLFILIGKYFDHDLNRNHIYTKAKLIEIRGKSRSASKGLIIEYHLSNKVYRDETSFLSDSLEYYQPNIGKTFLLKMHHKHWVNAVFSTYKLYIETPIPEEISAPENGWKSIPTNVIAHYSKNPLLILNGREIQKDTLQSIKPEQVKAVSILKSEQSTKKYGTGAQNGVVEITLK